MGEFGCDVERCEKNAKQPGETPAFIYCLVIDGDQADAAENGSSALFHAVRLGKCRECIIQNGRVVRRNGMPIK